MNDSKYESDDKEINDKDIERYVFEPISYHLSGEFDKENAKKAAALLKKAHPIMKKYLK